MSGGFCCTSGEGPQRLLNPVRRPHGHAHLPTSTTTSSRKLHTDGTPFPLSRVHLQTLPDYVSAAANGQKVAASMTTRFSSFPPYLLVQLKR